AGHDRLVEVHVLLAVDDEGERLGRGHLTHRAAHDVPDGHDREHRRCELAGGVYGNRGVRRRGVLLCPLGREPVLLLLGAPPDLVDRELHQYSSGSPAPVGRSLPSPSRGASLSTLVRAVGNAARRSGAMGSPVTSSIPYVPSSMRSSAACNSASSSSSCSRIET